jgi:hypothetical protein
MKIRDYSLISQYFGVRATKVKNSELCWTEKKMELSL